jgi:hypothetical protein
VNHDVTQTSQPGPGSGIIRSPRAIAAFVLLALALALPVLALEPRAIAQDGTGAATPTPPTFCIPPRVTVITGPREGESPLVPYIVETPESTPDASPIASPVASPLASPVASPVADATPRSSLEIDITETSRVLANCLSENKLDTVAALTGDIFRGQLLGASEPLDAATYIALAGTLTPVRYSIVSIESIRGTGRGTAEAIVTYTIAHQVRTGIWNFQLVDDGSARKWIVTSEEMQETRVPRNTPSIAVGMSNDTFRLTPAEVEGSSVALNGTNNDQGDHEMLVVRIASGASSDLLLTSPGPEFPEGVEFIGQLTVPARSTGSLVLTNLEPGTYTIVCLLPDEDGVPHLANGMQATFRVR